MSVRARATDLLQAVLQDLKGLRQVPGLSPGPGREERAAGGQRQSHQGQRGPDDPQLAHSPPLQNPMHVGADCAATHRRRPSETPPPRFCSIPGERGVLPNASMSKCPFRRQATAAGSSLFLVEVRCQTGFRAVKRPLLPAREPSSSVRAARLQTPGKCATRARTSTVASFSL